MIRVARILGRANIGGPARTVTALCEALNDGSSFHTVLFLGPTGSGEEELLPSPPPFEVRRVRGLRRSPNPFDLRAVRVLRRELERFRPDVVHTHASKAGLLGRLAAAGLARRPALVHTYHGHVLEGYFPAPVSSLLRRVERGLARGTDRLVAVSRRVADDLSGRHRVAPPEKFVVIENGIALQAVARADPRARRAARLALGAGEGRLLLVPARLVPVKDHATLFAALERLPDEVLPVEVHLLGDGPLRARLERRAHRLRRGVQACFHGFRSDVERLLPAADAVVLSSRNEGLPLALIEAMAAAVPVVATAVGGVPDCVEAGRTGWLVPPRDPRSLAFALAQALLDLGRARRMAEAARREAFARFDLRRVVEAHRSLYRELAAARTHRAATGDGAATLAGWPNPSTS